MLTVGTQLLVLLSHTLRGISKSPALEAAAVCGQQGSAAFPGAQSMPCPHLSHHASPGKNVGHLFRNSFAFQGTLGGQRSRLAGVGQPWVHFLKGGPL